MAAAFDASTTQANASGVAATTASFSLTTVAAATKIIIAAIYNANAMTATCTVGGSSATQLTGSPISLGTSTLFTFWFDASSAGSQAIVVTGSSAQYEAAAAASFSGVATGAPEALTTTTVTTSAAPSVSVTTLTANAMLVDVLGADTGSGSVTAGSGQTRLLIVNHTGASANGGALGYRSATTTGSYTDSYTITSEPWAMQMMSLAPSAGGGPTTPKSLGMMGLGA